MRLPFKNARANHSFSSVPAAATPGSSSSVQEEAKLQSGEEVYTTNPRWWWSKDNRPGNGGKRYYLNTMHRKRNILIVLGLVLLAIIALAVGLGVGLTRGKSTPSANLPSGGQDDSQSGLRESGYYVTSYSGDQQRFAWTAQNLSFLTQNQQDRIVVSINDSNVAQQIVGWGAAMTDSSAYLLSNLKTQNRTAYDATMSYLFNRRTGINMLRVPIGTSDFNPETWQYTMADDEGVQASSNDTVGPLSNFNMDGAKKYIIPTIQDALTYNPDLKLALLPWSPPAWMKSNDNINAGSLSLSAIGILPEYLVKSVLGFRSELGGDVMPWALSVQNEPTNPTAYPSMSMDNDYELRILAELRGRLAEEGLSSVQLLGHEDNFINWDDAAALMRYNSSALDGVAWHCYNGSSSYIANYTTNSNNQLTNKTMHMTECSGEDSTTQSDATSLQWWMTNIFTLPKLGVSSVMVWNLALDSSNGPRLNRAICQDCAGALKIDTSDGVSTNLQSPLLAQHAVASADLTRFGGGPASYIGSTITNDGNSCLDSKAFAANWTVSSNSSSTNVKRFGIVLENTCNNAQSAYLARNGQQASISVPSGITTYVWTA